MRVYIAGPMTGVPDWNHPAFHAAARTLREQGHEAINPAETFGGDTTRPRRDYMRAAVESLLRADAIHLMAGWQTSEGAKLEMRIAAELGLPFLPSLEKTTA